MSKKYRKAQRILKYRLRYYRIVNRWRKYGCSCGHHNMRGDK